MYHCVKEIENFKQRNFLRDVHQNLSTPAYVKIHLTVKFHIFHPSVFARERPQNFCHIQTDRHFVKLMKSCSGHPKKSKFVKTGCRK